MRFLWVCGSAIVGGAERATLSVLESLKGRGHEVAALSADGAVPASVRALGISVATAGLGRSPIAYFEIGSALRRWGPDGMLVTTPNEWAWSCLVPRGACRLVVVRHMVLPLARHYALLANRRADAVVAVSEAVRRNLVDATGISADLVHVVRNPVRFAARDAAPSGDEKRSARQRLGLPPDGHWIGFFSGTRPEKGFDLAVRAAATAHANGGDVHLLVCGPCRDGSAVESLAITQGIPGRIHLLGPTEDVNSALTACTLTLVPTRSDLSDAAPLIVAESMACGTPVVAFDTGGIAEMLGADGRAGLLARADDQTELTQHVVTLLRDSARADHLAAAALQRARNLFAPEPITAAYESLLSGLSA